MSDTVNHPKHYTSHASGVECIDVAEHMNFNLGNALKYIWRADHKNGIEDLKKAAWYINREIARLQPSSPETIELKAETVIRIKRFLNHRMDRDRFLQEQVALIEEIKKQESQERR
jgi:Protein of unknwon function (DUF3310)